MVHDGTWTEAGMCCVVSGPVVSPVLPTATRKWTSPYKITHYQDKFGKAKRKKVRNTVIFFIHIQIYYIPIQIIKLHQYTGVHSKNLNAHKSECFFARGRKNVCTRIVRGRKLFTIIPYSDMNKKYVNKFVESV